MRPTVPYLTAIAGVTALLGVTGCGSSAKHNTTAPAGSVTIKNFAFSPATLTVKAGTTVTITNNDSTDHTVTDSNGSFDTGHIAPGTSKSVTVGKAATYSYHCNIHTFMKGTIQASA